MVHTQARMKGQVKRIAEGVLEGERTSIAIIYWERLLDGYMLAEIARISARLRHKDHTWQDK